MTYLMQPLSALGNVQTGSTPLTAEEKYWGGDYPFVTPAELDQNTPITRTPRTLSDEGANQSRLLQEGAVMVCCIGSLGKIGIAGRSVVTNQQINSIEFDSTKILPRYGFYACQRLKPKLLSMAPATTIPIVSKSKFGQLEIPVPPYPNNVASPLSLTKLMPSASSAGKPWRNSTASRSRFSLKCLGNIVLVKALGR